MSRCWVTTDEASLDNPVGGIRRGRAEISGVYRTLFEGPARVQVEFFDYTLHACGDGFHCDAGSCQPDSGLCDACGGCMVTALLGPVAGFTSEERTAFAVLADSGLVPPLRLITGGASRDQGVA